MADDYSSEICSTGGGSCWNPKRSTTTGAGTRFEVTTALSCSTAITNLEVKSRSYDDSAGSGSGNSDIGSSITESTLQLPLFGHSGSPIDWSQTLLRGNEKAVTSLNQMAYFSHDQPTQVHAATEGSGMTSFNQSFILEQPRIGSCTYLAHEGVDSSYGSTLGPVTYNYPSDMVQGLLETSAKTQQPIYNDQSATSYADFLQPSWSKFPQYLQSPPSKQNQSSQVQLSNQVPLWNNTSMQSQLVAQTIEPKSTNSSLIERLSREVVQESCSSAFKKSDTETGFKKPRIETPSPLPTFKVRKEKLGDRITALQQLVSPFGKTDTASVLHEAIEYIKFLHEQVSVLSTPYLNKNGSPNPMQQQQQVSGISNEREGTKQDLRSRGLCLVPVASTYPVASETTTDFWHPTFGGTFR